MGVRFHCDAPNCAARAAIRDGWFPPEHPASDDARVTALAVEGLRDRENPAERPVIYLPPIGWTPIAMRDGRRLYACSAACRDEIVGREGRDPQGRRIGATCPACGQGIDGDEGGA